MSNDGDPEFDSLRSDVRPPPEPDARSAHLRRMVAQLVLDTTNEGIWLIDAQARTTFVNRHAAQLLGYTEEEMIGQHIFQFMDEERRPIAQANLMRRQKGVEDRQQVKLRKKDGTGIWVIGSANPVYDRDGRYAGALAMLGDLTAQKETEERLRTEVEGLRAQVASDPPHRTQAAPAGAGAKPAEDVSLAREALRSAVAIATCGTFLSAVVLFAAINMTGMVLGSAGQDDQG